MANRFPFRSLSVALALGVPGLAAADCLDAMGYSQARSGVALIVLKDGQPLCESYDRNFDVETAIELQSGTKSFASVIAAAAVQDGLLRLDEPVADTIPAWRDDPVRAAITIRQLLDLTSGLAASAGAGVVPSYDDALKASVRTAPGTGWDYGAVPFQVFGAVMRTKLARAGLPPSPVDYLQQRVLNQINIRPVRWTKGRDGMPHLSSGAHFVARDWARFGEFIRMGGVINGRALVDRDTLEQAMRPSAVKTNYGMTWWLIGTGGLGRNAPLGPGAITARAPSDWVMAAGVGKQRLLISRSAGLTVVRLAPPAGARNWSDRAFLTALLAPPSRPVLPESYADNTAGPTVTTGPTATFSYGRSTLR